ncbi:uncharacterized protein N7483_010137 [Penicillium malachiteum]|uniref:uncharacterized protein n=1 Tax=Penicillium malachiteum TaxID=1324776 RepID=UPI002546FC1C|nr:uncharacterized protein N7483_010137 [Penicillium malachiteum]KAJ5712956.1 hypothetical protein N7483_010137 [Penicillium malachiteum]
MAGKADNNPEAVSYCDFRFRIESERTLDPGMGTKRSSAKQAPTHGSNKIVQKFRFRNCTASPCQQVKL